MEPYVLPQLLTQVFESLVDGILFSSTRINVSLAKLRDEPRLNLYRENAVLFTKYGSSEHDNALLGKFDISEPLLASKSFPEITAQEIEQA